MKTNRVTEWQKRRAQWDAASNLERVFLQREWLQNVVQRGADTRTNKQKRRQQ